MKMGTYTFLYLFLWMGKFVQCLLNLFYALWKYMCEFQLYSRFLFLSVRVFILFSWLFRMFIMTIGSLVCVVIYLDKHCSRLLRSFVIDKVFVVENCIFLIWFFWCNLCLTHFFDNSYRFLLTNSSFPTLTLSHSIWGLVSLLYSLFLILAMMTASFSPLNHKKT